MHKELMKEFVKNEGKLQIINSNEEVEILETIYWGHDSYFITEKEIEALKQGKTIMSHNGEYSFSIKLIE